MVFPLLLLALLYERDGSGDSLGLFPGSVVRFEADTGVTRCLPRERERERERERRGRIIMSKMIILQIYD